MYQRQYVAHTAVAEILGREAFPQGDNVWVAHLLPPLKRRHGFLVGQPETCTATQHM
jgi:hypothetical protein